MPACARKILELFGVDVEEHGGLRISTYCCATFTASRTAIRRHPLSLWRYLYEVVGTGANQCVWSDHVRVGEWAPGLMDLNEGFIMEHIWHAIFGEPLNSAPHRGDETCRFASCGKYCPDPSRPELGMFAAFTPL